MAKSFASVFEFSFDRRLLTIRNSKGKATGNACVATYQNRRRTYVDLLTAPSELFLDTSRRISN